MTEFMRAPAGRGRSQAAARGFGRGGRGQFADATPDVIEGIYSYTAA